MLSNSVKEVPPAAIRPIMFCGNEVGQLFFILSKYRLKENIKIIKLV